MAEVDLGKLEEVVERVVASEGLEYVHADLRGDGPGALLRVTIDRPEGVTHDDCSVVSRELNTILDVEDLIPFSYTLEVSSPGLGRALAAPGAQKRDVHKAFERHRGETVRVRASEEVEGRTSFKGRLERVTPDEATVVERSGREFTIPLSKIFAANLVQSPKGARAERPQAGDHQ